MAEHRTRSREAATGKPKAGGVRSNAGAVRPKAELRLKGGGGRREPDGVRDAVYWFEAGRAAALPPLTGAAWCDTVVVGGGMMGLMAARTLEARGLEVVVVEADRCGGGASGRSSGFITPDSELEFSDLVDRYGEAEARRLWEFALGGVGAIADMLREEQIDADQQRQGAAFVALGERSARTVRREHAARVGAGFGSRLVCGERMADLLGAEGYSAAVQFGGTFGINAHQACVGLRDRLEARGVRIFEQSPVRNITPRGLETAGGEVRARHILVCADRWLPRLGLARPDLYHAQTFLGISQPLADADVARLFPAGPLMVWDTGLVYHYFRLTGGNRLLVGGGTLGSTYSGGEVHRPEAAARRLERYLGRHVPWLSVKLEMTWPGLIGVTKDFAPALGRAPGMPSVHFAGGAAGLPWAAALGRYLAHRILNGRDDFDAVLRANRRYPVPRKVQALTGKKLAFALAHGAMKSGLAGRAGKRGH